MAEYRLKILDWPKDKSLREKAMKRGIETLGDAELLGILDIVKSFMQILPMALFSMVFMVSN